MKHLGWKIFATIGALVAVVCLFNRSPDGAGAALVMFSIPAFAIALIRYLWFGTSADAHDKRVIPARVMAYAAGAFVLAVVMIGFSPKSSTTAASTEKATPKIEAASNPEPQQVDAATPEPTPHEISRQEQKKNFLETVDESISGARIAGNPYKFVGKNVDLHCSVASIPDEHFINATCPAGEYGLGPSVVIQTDSRGLEKDQRIRVIGTVEDPMEGTNAMGGSMKFPTVKAEFME